MEVFLVRATQNTLLQAPGSARGCFTWISLLTVTKERFYRSSVSPCPDLTAIRQEGSTQDCRCSSSRCLSQKDAGGSFADLW